MKSCRKILEARVHQPLQIRTYKHRCFVFCPGQTSLICVPGIGKKNEILLQRIGINDLAHLFVKYRQINDIQRFRQWLQTHVGFSSYQSKMTTCAVASKLGDIQEIDTGLKPICCPTKRFKLDSSLNENDDDLLAAAAVSQDRSFRRF